MMKELKFDIFLLSIILLVFSLIFAGLNFIITIILILVSTVFTFYLARNYMLNRKSGKELMTGHIYSTYNLIRNDKMIFKILILALYILITYYFLLANGNLVQSILLLLIIIVDSLLWGASIIHIGSEDIIVDGQVYKFSEINNLIRFDNKCRFMINFSEDSTPKFDCISLKEYKQIITSISNKTI